jgi:hypothetical protein
MDRDVIRILWSLLNEGVDVWRSVQAEPVSGSLNKIVSTNRDPDTEDWEFQAGDTVRCEQRSFGGGDELVAVERVQ